MSDKSSEIPRRSWSRLGRRVALGRLIRRKLSDYTPRNKEERNILFVTLDGMALGLTIAASSFLSVFVVRLGASAFWVSLLSSLPALIQLTLTLPLSRLVERQRRIVPLFAWSRIIGHSAYVWTGLLPFFLSAERAAQSIVLLWGAVAIVTTMQSLAFTLVMNQAVSRERRAIQMSSRWTAMGVSKIVALIIAGQILQRVRFPLNYQIVFIGSFSADVLAFYFISQVYNPEQEPPPRRVTSSEPLKARLRASWRGIWQCQPFVRFTVAREVFSLGMAIMAPLIPIYWVRNLHASDAWVSYFTTTVSVTTLIAYGFWVRVKRRQGNRRVLLISTLGRSVYPLLVALTPSPAIMLIVAAYNGLVFAGENLMFFDAFLDTVPKGKEARFVAISHTFSNLVAFVGPPVGAFLLPYLGIRGTLASGSAMAFEGFLLFLLGGVGKEST